MKITMTPQVPPLTILKDSDLRLRQISRPVQSIDDDLRTFIGAMITTMQISRGCGIAAIQVGRPLRVFAVQMPAQYHEAQYYEKTSMRAQSGGSIRWSGGALADKVDIFINPFYGVPPHGLTSRFPEGCLSISNQSIDIERPSCLTLHYKDMNGHNRCLRTEGLMARIIQHEMDHLDGKLITDYLT